VSSPHIPLAERLRPRTLGDVIGQQHLLGEVKDIREAVELAEAARDGLQAQGTIVFVDEVHRFNKAVKSYINQWLRNAFVQFIVLPHCSVGVKHG